MPDPTVGGPAAEWPPPYSQAFVDQARALLEIRPVLAIVGPAGASRHRLAADIADLAVPSGAKPLSHTGRPDERDRPYSTLHRLFPRLQVTPDTPAPAVASAVHTALADLGHGSPVLVLAETDLCDPHTIATLTRVAVTGDLRLIATLTPETAAHHDVLLSAAEVVDVPPLDDARISALLRTRFGVRPHPLLVSLLAGRTGGAYSAVRDVADASFAAGLIGVVEDVLVPLSAATMDTLASRRPPCSAERLGGGQQITDLVQLTALLGRLDVDDARSCASPDAVELAIRHGAFTLHERCLVLASCPESMLVRRAMGDHRPRELFDTYAHQVPRTLARPDVAVPAADWWIAADQPLPADLAVRAARDANRTCRHERAIAYTEAAANEQHTDIAPLERVYALTQLSGGTELGALLSTVDGAALDEDELLVYLHAVAAFATEEDREHLVGLAIADPDPTAGRRRAAVWTLAALVDRVFDAANDETINRLRTLAFSAPLSPCNRAATFATLAVVLRQAGRPVQAVDAAEFALEILAGEGDRVTAFHLRLAREAHLRALISAMDLEGAERALAIYSSGPCAHPGRTPLMTALETSLAMLQGDFERALASARLCLTSLHPTDPHRLRRWMEATLAQILVLRGRHDEARPLLQAAERGTTDRRQIDLERRISLAWTHDVLAEPEEALRLLAEVADEARAHGLCLALINATALSVQIGGPPHLATLLEVVDGLVDPTGVPLIWQTFARAAHRRDRQALIDLAELADSSHARLFAAAVAQYVLDTSRRRTDLDAPMRARLEQLADPATRQVHVPG